jgi:putative NADPH-quinone reductase
MFAICKAYLRDGVWVDMFYGEQQQGKIRNRLYMLLLTIGMVRRKGQPKRNVGYISIPTIRCVPGHTRNA